MISEAATPPINHVIRVESRLTAHDVGVAVLRVSYAWWPAKLTAWLGVLSLLVFVSGPLLPQVPPLNDRRPRTTAELLWEGRMSAVWAVVFLVGVPFAQYVAGRRRWATMPELQQPVVFEFGDDGISAAAATSTGRFGWDHVIRVIATRRLLILVGHANLMRIVSRAAVASSGRAGELRELIIHKVPGARMASAPEGDS